MFATAQDRTRLLKSPISTATLVRFFLDPAVIIAALFVSAAAHQQEVGRAYMILALVVFSLTFPGTTHASSSTRTLVRDVVLGWLALFAILALFGYATKSLGAFAPEVLRTWFIVTPAALAAAHVAMRTLLPRIANLEANQSRAVIIGANELGLSLSRAIRESAYLGIKLVGFLDDRTRERLGDVDLVPLLGPSKRLPAFVKQHDIDVIYIALPMVSQPRVLGLLDELRDTTASIYFVPDIFIADLIQARLDSIGGMPVVAVCETPFQGLNGVIKRVTDIVFSALILLAVAPLMIAIAAGVKLTSPGPVFFRQRRYGLDGKEIIVYKFRSMTVCEDGAVVPQATREDPRITPLGTLLRRMSLDELPQFINVLQGRMSIVGPRPHAVAHNEMYRKLIRSYMVRHKVRPGITGWAQVNGFRGETETLDKMKSRIEHDLAYLRNWSLKLDLQIILRTACVVFRDRHAH